MRITLRADKKKCGIEIGSLEMFIADFAHNNDLKPTQPSSKLRGKVAVIGSGPAGLTVAGDLAKMDFDVTIFEAQSEPGGVLLFGIPEFRLQKDVVRREISELQHIGVEIRTKQLAGVDFTVDDLLPKAMMQFSWAQALPCHAHWISPARSCPVF